MFSQQILLVPANSFPPTYDVVVPRRMPFHNNDQLHPPPARYLPADTRPRISAGGVRDGWDECWMGKTRAKLGQTKASNKHICFALAVPTPILGLCFRIHRELGIAHLRVGVRSMMADLCNLSSDSGNSKTTFLPFASPPLSHDMCHFE